MKPLCFKTFLSSSAVRCFLCFVVLLKLSDGSQCNRNPYIKDAGPLVKTKTGTIVGNYVKVFDTEIASFTGIPYAKPPLGEKRFAKPDPIGSWEGTLFAQEKPSSCMQFSSRKFAWIPTNLNTSEDCLYLNIWTPITYCCSTFNKLPVLVWIHGGGYYSGSSSMDVYDGSILSSYGDVIVVSINYRVGIFGFLNSGTVDAPGNVGVHDQLLALKWIKENIQHFGGDSESITLFGQSAGSLSTSLHVLSPLSKGLFHKAIMQSGTVYQPHLIDEFTVAQFKAGTYAEIVGCSTPKSNLRNNPTEVLSCLKKKDPQELAQAENIFTSKFPYYFAPSFGTNCAGCDEFLPESPITMLDSGKASKIPLLIGSNLDEGAIFLTYIMPDVFNINQKTNLTLLQAKEIIGALFFTAPEVPPELIYDFYFRNITQDDDDSIVKAISNAFGDYVFTCPDMFFAEKTKAYLYWITHRSLKDASSSWIGVTHFNEVPYLFGEPIGDSHSYTPEDGRFSGEIIKKWTSFAREGYPLKSGITESWPRFSSDDPVAYELNARSEGSLPFPRLEACEFWRPYFKLPSS